jgi:F0F1-type ATP synthase delta subunit
MQKLSRRNVTTFIADQLRSGGSVQALMAQLAAYLVDHHQVKQAAFYVRDIEAALSAHGQKIADVYTAHELDTALRTQLEAQIGQGVTLREHIDTDMIGGIIIKTADGEYDASLRRTVQRLKTS